MVDLDTLIMMCFALTQLSIGLCAIVIILALGRVLEAIKALVPPEKDTKSP